MPTSHVLASTFPSFSPAHTLTSVGAHSTAPFTSPADRDREAYVSSWIQTVPSASPAYTPSQNRVLPYSPLGVREGPVYEPSHIFRMPAGRAPQRRRSDIPVRIPAPPILLNMPLDTPPSTAWPLIAEQVYNIRVQPEPTRDGYIRLHNDPTLYFLGSPADFSPELQARELRGLIEEARRSGEFLGARFMPINAERIRRNVRATLPNGTVIEMSADWMQTPSTSVTHEVGTQTDQE